MFHHSSQARLAATEQQRFLKQSESAHGSYKGIDLGRLLRDFEANQPTLKDVTVLLAMSFKFVRYVDSTLPPPVTSQHVRQWLEAEEMLAAVLKLEKEAANGGDPHPRRRAKQFLVTNAPNLADAYNEHGAGPTN